MQVTKAQLQAIYREANPSLIDRFLPHLVETVERFGIHTPRDIRMFLAQIGHESGQLRYREELASGSSYEGRKALGNTEPGDGQRYKGRGLLQITGRSNYKQCGLALGLPLLENPSLLAQDRYAALSAGWFWKSRNLSAWSEWNDFETQTRKINGGLNGYADRLMLLKRAEEVIV